MLTFILDRNARNGRQQAQRKDTHYKKELIRSDIKLTVFFFDKHQNLAQHQNKLIKFVK